MTLATLRDDALRSTPGGFSLRLSLPWIRSLPVSSMLDLEVTVDGSVVNTTLADADPDRWWFLQDRLDVRGARRLEPGPHQVSVSFRLSVPYLPAGPGPLTLPFAAHRTLTLDAEHAPSLLVASRPAAVAARSPALPSGWTLAASAFNWTPEVIFAERPAADIVSDIVSIGVADTVELEPGQLWRSFPDVHDDEAVEFSARIRAAGGSVSIVGASLDDWASPTRRRTDAERLAFLLPQLRAAHEVGAQGVRLPAGQAGRALIDQALPTLHELDLVLFEEVQGQHPPTSPEHAALYETIADVDDPHVRLLVDISMLMPALPVTYLERLEAGGIPDDLVEPLRTAWKDPSTQDSVVDLLRSGGVPPQLHALYMDMIVRFGRSDAAELSDILPMIGAFHLKFWDLEDEDARVSQPIDDLGALLSGSDFAGTLCSEWGGHEWLDLDPTTTTSRHLALARAALHHGANRNA